MPTWENKTFRVLGPIRKAFEAQMGRKGEQMYAISAGMLWYVQADAESRLAYEALVRRIEAGLASVDDMPNNSVASNEIDLLMTKLFLAIDSIDELKHSRALTAGESSAGSLDRGLKEATKRVQKKQAAKRSRKKSG